MGLFDLRPTGRIIDWLRVKYPEHQWQYDAVARQWENDAGWAVEARSHLAPQYEGDDETYWTVYIRTDTGERLW